MTSRRHTYRNNRRGIGVASGGAAAVSYPIEDGLVAHFSTWYGDDVTHMTVASGRISQFTNPVTAVAWAQGTAAAQLTYRADSLASSLNGFPSGYADAGDHYFGTEAAVLTIAQSNTDHTVIALVSADVAAAFGIFFSWGNSGATTGYRAYGLNSTGVLLASVNGGGASSALGTTVLENGKPYAIAFRLSSNQISAFLDGALEMPATAQNTGALASVNRAGICTRARSTNDLKWVGQMGEIFVYNRALTDAEIIGQSAWLRGASRWQLDYRRGIVEGNSITRGFGTVSGLRLDERLPPLLTPTPQQLFSAATNGAEVGANMIPELATQITPRRRWSSAFDWVHLWGGTNDIAFRDFTGVPDPADRAALIYADITTWVASVKASGFRAVISTVLPRSSDFLCLDGVTLFNDVRAPLNVLITGNAAGADAVYDACGVAIGLGASWDGTPNIWASDNTHLTDYLTDILAAGQATTINALP